MMVADRYELGRFINADVIEKNLRQDQPGFDDIWYQRTAFETAALHRERCLAEAQTFSFETVFSHRSRLEFLQAASTAGFRVRLFYIATGKASLNVDRVAYRVQRGGHDIPIDKILARYERSLSLLPHALRLVDEAHIFENDEIIRNVVTMHRNREAPAQDRFELSKSLPPWAAKALREYLRLGGILDGEGNQ